MSKTSTVSEVHLKVVYSTPSKSGTVVSSVLYRDCLKCEVEVVTRKFSRCDFRSFSDKRL